MPRTLAAVLVLLQSVLAPLALRAQAPEHFHDTRPRVYAGPPLGLRQAIDEALQRNPTLLTLRRQFEAIRLRPAQEQFLPPPTLEAQIWQWPVTSLGPLNTSMYMFTIQQELPGTGKRDARLALGEADTAMASADVAVRARDVVSQVTRSYADLAVARRGIDVHLVSVDVLRQMADASAVEYAAGRRPQQDVLKSVAELSKLHEDLVMHEEAAALAAARLNALLDREPDTPIGALDAPREVVTLPPSTDLQRIALERQPELQAAHKTVERAAASLRVADRDGKPDLMVGGGYMLMPREWGAWTASLAVTWPNAPWTRGRVDARKAEALAAVEASNANVHTVERGIQLAVHEAYVRVTAASQRVALLRSTVVPQSAQTLESARIAYQANRLDFLTLVDTQRALLDAELSYVRALSDREVALADLARAVGVDTLEAIEPSAAPKEQTR